MTRPVVDARHRRSATNRTPSAYVMSVLSHPFIHKVLPIVIFLCMFALLFYLRLLPAIGHHVDFVLDSAFHYRMTDILLRTGTIPPIDTLSTYPEGKDINSLLPSGLYHVCAACHRIINLFMTAQLTTTILLLCSFCGSLIALPVYLISLELYHNNLIALTSGSLAGLIPAYLNRTMCYWYRYEVLAVPILFLSFLFFLRLFTPSSRTRVVVNGAATTALLLAALYVWRLSVLFVIAYLGCLLYISLRSGRNIKLVIVVACILLCVYTILIWFVPGFGIRNRGFNYGNFPIAVLEITLNKIGVSTPYSEFTRLVLDNQELQGIGLIEMFSWDRLSLSAGFIGMFLLRYLGSRQRSAHRDILFASLVIFTVLFLLVFRNVVLLAPFVGIAAGDSVVFVLNEKKKRGIRYAVLTVVLIISTTTAWDAYRMASTRGTRLDPYLAQAVVQIRTLAPPDTAVSCYWADGYVIQTYCNRPTLTDGLFESREIVRRILEESKAYYSQEEDDLWNYCTRYGAAYLLLPVRRKESYADQAGVPYGKYFTSKGPTTLGSQTILARLLYDPSSLRRFREIFRSRGYVLYEIIRS